MNKIGINRVWGIILALGILFAGFILFNLMTYLEIDKQIKELEQTAMIYNSNYQVYLQTSGTLRDYNEKISTNAYELSELERLMNSVSLNYRKNDNKVIFSGNVNTETFSRILNFLSEAKTLKINKLDAQSQSELPLLIGESKAPDMYINQMEIELIQIDERILEG